MFSARRVAYWVFDAVQRMRVQDWPGLLRPEVAGAAEVEWWEEPSVADWPSATSGRLGNGNAIAHDMAR